jgi:N-acetylglucosaminyl-diphospho-decaprenol L-rhamnosyltransferase
MQDLTIIILGYNSGHIIKKSLDNINFNKHKVIVVDNASKDNTVEFVKNNFSQVELIKINQNLGYGRGNNIALNQVETEFALVLNPDALIDDDSICKVLEIMKSNSEIAIAGPLILEQNEISNEEIFKEKARIEQYFLSCKDMFYEKIGNNYDSRFISGACMFLRMDIFRKIGFFDEKIFLFYEDDEISWRAKNNGFKNLTITEAFVCHIGASSCKKTWRGTYRRNWHLKGWSKLYFKEIRKGKFRAKKSAVRLVFSYFFKSLISLAKFNRESMAINLGAFSGSAAFLIGMEAFDKNGNPRG